MVIADIFNLSDEEYGLRIKSYPTDKLLNQLKVKNMQVKVGTVIGSSATVTSTMATSVLGDYSQYTSVICGGISQAGKRRVVVSKQKIRLMEAELERRGSSVAEIEGAGEALPAHGELELVIDKDDMSMVSAKASPENAATGRWNPAMWMALIFVPLAAVFVWVVSINGVVLQELGAVQFPILWWTDSLLRT
jgi:hypothetical protein